MRKPWTVVLVGAESGRTTTMSFARFRRREQAQAFADKMNSRPNADLARAEVRRRRT